MELNNISLNMVVKNEEKNIRKCLMSVKYLVKEMIIVDTGSTDNTVNICKEFGAKVIEHPVDKWTGNNCIKSRQLALDNSTRLWVLVLDADEEMSSNLDSEIRKFIHQSNYSCLRIKRDSFFKDRKSYGDAIVRLFRNRFGYEWMIKGTDGDIIYRHENISLETDRVNYGNVINSENKLYHFGWYDITDEELNEKKARYEESGYEPFVKRKVV